MYPSYTYLLIPGLGGQGPVLVEGGGSRQKND